MKHKSLEAAGLLILLLLTGCGGTRLLWKPKPLVLNRPLSIASDRHLAASLDGVIFRDGPGTWAKNVDWDEYIIKVRNVGNGNLTITRITALDSLDTRVESLNDRRQLVKGTRNTKRRYKGQGINVKAGLGPGAILGTGAIATAGTAAIVGSALAATSSGVGNLAGIEVYFGVIGTTYGGLILVPAIAAYRAINNSQVNRQIALRHAQLPFELGVTDVPQLSGREAGETEWLG